jgi:serine/threonine protein kinase
MFQTSHREPYRSQITSEGQKIGRYVLTKKIGQGQYGAVWLAKHLDTGNLFAVKKLDRSQIDSSQILKRLLQTEISIMHEISHPNIMHLFEFLSSNRHYYLVIKFCNQGDFESYMKEKKTNHFQEADAVLFFKQIMNGFFELRKHKVLHRDFKLANVFMHNERLIIGDFGFAKSGQEVGETRLGSPMTMAPELLFSVGDDLVYNSKADLWSIGVVFYQILFGEPPFWGRNVAELKKSLLANSGSRLKFPKPVSEEAQDLLKSLLTLDPERRIAWKRFFNHEIFKKHDKMSSRVEISRAFGPKAIKQIEVTQNEFCRNMEEQDSDRQVAFYDQEEFANLDKTIDQNQVSEEQIGENLDDQLQADIISTEVYFRYCHELNKIFFQVYSVHKLQSFLKESLFLDGTAVIMNICFIIIREALARNFLLIDSLKASKNTLEVHQYAFQTFCSSPKFRITLDALESNALSLKKHLLLIVKRFKANNVPLSYPDLITESKNVENLLVKYYSKEYAKLKTLNLAIGRSNDPITLRKYYQLMVIANYNQDLLKFFPYLTDSSRNPKLNWNGFYYTLERATSNELRILI